MIYMFLSNNPSSGDLNSSNLPCFHCFSCFSGRCTIFLSSFHSLHLFHQFQADCVYKKSLEDACYFLLQSVSLVFYSFSLFQLFQWKMSNFFKPVSFVTLVSAVSGRLCL